MSKRKLLLADDSVTIQKVVNLTFADEGIEVISVGDGDSAMAKILETSPDLVMLDVNMPGLNGYEICENLRKNERFNGIPVILLVGSFEPFDEDEARRVGANDYLTKPFQSIRQLVNTVTNLLGAEKLDENPLIHESISETKPEEIASVSMPLLGLEDEKSIDVVEADVHDIGESVSEDKIDFPIEVSENFDSKVSDVADFDIETLENNHHEVSFTETIESSENLEKDEHEIVIDESKHELEMSAAFGGYSSDAMSIEPVVSREEAASSVESEIDEINLDTEQIDEKSLPEIEMQFGEVSESEVPTEEFKFTSSDIETEPLYEESGDVLEGEIPHFAHDFSPASEETPLESFPFPEAASILELDEDNLLEIAPREEDFLVNMDDDNDFDSEIRFDDLAFGESAFESTPHSVAAPVIKKEMKYDIDEATIDEIVNRVIAKLSDSVVREVAWEVVPTKADAIIKQLAEEKLENS